MIVGSELTSFCLAADAADAADETEATAEGFSRLYQFGDDLSSLPQTLTVDPGGASSAVASVRGYRGGIEVARDRAAFEFDGVSDIALSLARCPDGGGTRYVVEGTAELAGASHAVASFGNRGTLVVAVGAGVAGRFVLGESFDSLVGGVPEPLATAPTVVRAFDVDGDCDDDVVIGYEGQGTVLWMRGANGSFTEVSDAFAGSSSSARALAEADVDGDGDTDLVIGDAESLVLWRNDGTGRFAAAPGALATDATRDITALAFANVNSDGRPDLIVGRGREAPLPVRLLIGQESGTLVQVTAATPETELSVQSMAVADLDGDRVDDVIIATVDSTLRVFAGRGDGRLEDRSFLYFPDGSPTAAAVASGDWNGDCLADAVVSLEGGNSNAFRGTDVGFSDDSGPALTGMVQGFFDLNDDGNRDVLLLGDSGGLVWLKR